MATFRDGPVDIALSQASLRRRYVRRLVACGYFTAAEMRLLRQACQTPSINKRLRNAHAPKG
ncbi:MAG: hypothetical protein EOR89_12490 [Mesorhizobium sp.]|nr:MAG: hypothetical protein EOR89_12490 [Mesorhizobium sp.]